MIKIQAMFCTAVILTTLVGETSAQQQEQVKAASEKVASVEIFDGTFEGWQGDMEKIWRIEDETLIAGDKVKPAARNEFLCSTKSYDDFELTLEFKTTGTEKINAGVQFRSQLLRKNVVGDQPRPPQQYHEVVGYQADIGEGYHGCLYDEHRRNKVLSRPDETVSQKVTAAIPEDGWQSYRIRAVGNRVQLWLNGVQTVDFVEEDDSIWRKGIIALQIHGDMVGTIAYRNISVCDLSATTRKFSIVDMDWISGHWSGDALGGQFEETWNPATAGEMLGMFKLIQDDKVVFYELMTIVPHEDSYVLRLKHFGPGLVGWEEKDKSVEFPLESISETEIKFKGLKFSRATESSIDEMKIEVVTEHDGKTETLVFDCKRVR
jgi:hypothetical protein